MQIFLEDSHTTESSFCHLTTAADAAAVAVDGEAAAEVAAAAVADAAAAVAAAVDAAEDVAGPPPLVCPVPVFQVHLSSSAPAR